MQSRKRHRSEADWQNLPSFSSCLGLAEPLVKRRAFLRKNEWLGDLLAVPDSGARPGKAPVLGAKVDWAGLNARLGAFGVRDCLWAIIKY